VKATDGNLLEVITSNDMVPDLTPWKEVTDVAIHELQNQVKIYPNPTDGELRVTSYELRVEGIEIFDLSGKTVGANLCVRPNGMGYINIDISNLPDGMYFVRITTENGTTTEKIIKN
jgi:hypothetical protein